MAVGYVNIKERARRQDVEAQHTLLLAALVQKDVKIAELEAKLASMNAIGDDFASICSKKNSKVSNR